MGVKIAEPFSRRFMGPADQRAECEYSWKETLLPSALESSESRSCARGDVDSPKVDEIVQIALAVGQIESSRHFKVVAESLCREDGA